MTSEQLDLLRRALREVGTREVRYYESLPQTTHTPSERFEKRIQKLIRTQKTPIYPLIKSPTRKAVTVLVAVMLLFSLSLSVSAIREPVFSAFERITEKFTEIIFPTKYNTPFIEYEVGWVPENYEITKTINTGTTYISEWEAHDSRICLNQSTLAHTHYNTEGVRIQEVEWSGKKVSYFQVQDNYLFSWTENNNLFTLTCTSTLPLTDIQRIIESICPVESETP